MRILTLTPSPRAAPGSRPLIKADAALGRCGEWAGAQWVVGASTRGAASSPGGISPGTHVCRVLGGRLSLRCRCSVSDQQSPAGQSDFVPPQRGRAAHLMLSVTLLPHKYASIYSLAPQRFCVFQTLGQNHTCMSHAAFQNALKYLSYTLLSFLQ